jgi:opacity protein-like surface antigen
MKKLLLTTAIAIAMGSTAAFAHHPAAEIVDADVYAMIEENISEVHLDMTFDDMGGDTDVMSGDTSDVGSTRSSVSSDIANYGTDMGADMEDVGAELAGELDIDAAEESRQVENSVADVEPSGPGAQR